MKKSIIFSLVLLLTQSVLAKDIKVPGDYRNIQDAINASSDGDRILVASGNYSEFLKIEKSIKIIGTPPCTLYASTSPIKSVRNKKALINIADNEVSIEGINLVGTYLDNGKLSTAHPTSSYCTVAIDSKDAFLDIKSMTINGFTQSYFVVNGGVMDVTNVKLSPTSSIHPAPPLAFKLDDVGGLTIKGLTCVNPKVKNILAINEVFKGVRESFILISDTEIGNAQLERGRKESYTISAVVNQKEKAMITDKVVFIPDSEFKKLLVNNSLLNTNHDDEIQVSEAKVYDEFIVCSKSGINDLTGIEAFTSLSRLECSYNNLTTLDLSKNKNLKILKCVSNQLTALDVSKNLELVEFWCYDNHLTEINVSNNTKLENFMCISNKLTSIDVSKNKALVTFRCNDNQLSTIDVSNNTLLEDFTCGKNQISRLNVSKNLKLKKLSISNNELSSIDLRVNTALESLECQFNNISKLDLRKCTNLKMLLCGSNKITSLDLSNNINVRELNINKSKILETVNLLNLSDKLKRFYAKETPNLTCILVDNVNDSKKQWSKKVQNLSAIKNSCEGVFTETGDEEISESLVPLPPVKGIPTSNKASINFDKEKEEFTTIVEGKNYNLILPKKLQYKSHDASKVDLIIAYSSKETGDNYIGVWNNKLQYLSEYNFKKIMVKAYTTITTNTNENIILVHYYDPTYKTEFVGVFNNVMQYLGQYELTGKKNIKIQKDAGNPSVVYIDGNKKKRVEFDVTGNQISLQSL